MLQRKNENRNEIGNIILWVGLQIKYDRVRKELTQMMCRSEELRELAIFLLVICLACFKDYFLLGIYSQLVSNLTSSINNPLPSFSFTFQ